MPKDKRARKGLSKSVLEMKFMQRSKQRYIAEKDAEEGRAVHESDITEEMKNAENKIGTISSYVPVLELRLGRVSYGGINPEIERLMPENQIKAEIVPSDEKDVSDWEMLKLSSVSNTVNNKFKTKKARNKALKKLKGEAE